MTIYDNDDIAILCTIDFTAFLLPYFRSNPSVSAKKAASSSDGTASFICPEFLLTGIFNPFPLISPVPLLFEYLCQKKAKVEHPGLLSCGQYNFWSVL